MEFTHFLKT